MQVCAEVTLEPKPKPLRTCGRIFYWPAVIDDAAKLVSTCQACQKFSRKTKAPAQPMQLIAPS
jgi:hypothetical protein